jgi:hypothetical protein
MLIFHGRVQTVGSSMVASYVRVSGLRAVMRSTTCSASLWKFARAIEPRLIVEPPAVDDERHTSPAPVGPSQPAVGGRLGLLGHVDRAHHPGKLVDDHDVILALDDLERVRHQVARGTPGR